MLHSQNSDISFSFSLPSPTQISSPEFTTKTGSLHTSKGHFDGGGRSGRVDGHGTSLEGFRNSERAVNVGGEDASVCRNQFVSVPVKWCVNELEAY